MELEKVKIYLDEHFTEKISLDDLSDRFFINKYYLTRIFKETYGVTISHYVLFRRITKDFIDAAKEEPGNIAVAEVLPEVVKETGSFVVSEGYAARLGSII